MKIGIVGCAGRMGQMLVREVLKTDGAELAGGTEPEGSPAIGRDLGALVGADDAGVTVTDDPKALFQAADAVIDFTRPEPTMRHADLAAETGTALIIGTTGLSAEQEAEIGRLGEKTPIVLAPNMSVGVNLLFALTQKVAATLGIDYDVEIVEMHHRHKVDAPSGTALGLGRAAAAGRGVALDEAAVWAREGHTGPRKAGDIGFATLRGGDVVGDHTVVFAADGERVELTHKASDRAVFAKGAVRAALWCDGRAPGKYSMFDVLGLSVD
ncbi:4-hydroxy-tetrahydrodipicolinate reductase [Caenispirillum salinarum]|uniref:4-hydroxy-tetrahydrodipicolinate reductase n=1 Tax=Caenispirillum salinarum TaxID=859058 RepID=UPI00384DDA6D